MLHHILEPGIQEFIRRNTGKPVAQLALQKNPFPHADWTSILNQIAAREKAKDKLPTWFEAEDIVYPTKISVEQTSSEKTAKYKAGLVSGNNLIDLTGGFGVDDFHFAQQVKEVTHCELNIELSAIAAHNFKVLGVTDVQCIPGDSLNTLTSLDKQWDWLYIDPSRRSDAKGKVFMLQDCLPNVPKLLDTYFGYSRNIMIKTAPILDISAGLSELHSVKAIHIVALNNEVKELLWILEKDFDGVPLLHTLNITKDSEETFSAPMDNDTDAVFSLPRKYLYEPNSSIMKSGLFNAVSAAYSVNKFHQHTHLYTSDAIVDFPGRKFIIHQIMPYQKVSMKQLEGKKMNITTRNFPLQVDELRKKWKIKDGGETYAFFTTDMKNGKIVLLCAKI